MSYELFYWPEIQGRGEFVRLALEAAGAPYRDVAREDGVPAMMAVMRDAGLAQRPFAPPFLRHEGLVLAQTANILLYLGPRLGLAPADEGGRLFAHQLQLTVGDLVDAAHDTHHPIDGELYYEDQKPEAARRAEGFRGHRIGKYLGYFEGVLAANPAAPAHLVGEALTYADLSLFQVVEGLRYAFPKAMARLEPAWLKVTALVDRVAALPAVAAYLASERRIAFNEQGIFRRYAELDG
jgi:glutathione S-transferase